MIPHEPFPQGPCRLRRYAIAPSRRVRVLLTLLVGVALPLTARSAEFTDRATNNWTDLPPNLRRVLEHTRPLAHPRDGRLPLLVLPISQSLAGVTKDRAESVLRALDQRGIGYSVAWNPGDADRSLAEALRIGSLQQHLNTEVVIDATACLQGFFDGSEATFHVDEDGRPFPETSFGGRLGCPFALEARVPDMTRRVGRFLDAYREANLPIDLAFADWEIDGPIEWNDAWSSSKRCRRCRENLPGLDDFRLFQRRLRQIRADLQRRVFAEPVLAHSPQALVGNYGVHPHDGYRRWYDYFERETPGVPTLADQRARYREWADEFGGTRYTCGLPVIYPWYGIHDWYDYADSDFRWFYNLLLEGSAAGRHTPSSIPLIPFVHGTTTAPPENPDPRVRQMTAGAYREMLWHLLLRGHDTFFLWCLPAELADEIEWVHSVYAESLAYRGFLDRGQPVEFRVPSEPGPVLSGLRLGNRVLVRRTDFSEATEDVRLSLADGQRLSVPRRPGLQVLDLEPQRTGVPSGLLRRGDESLLPIGFYDLPEDDGELRALSAAGVNLVRCRNRNDLDRAQATGLLGWVPVPVQDGPTDDLRRRVLELQDHPALAVWEGPDEVVWMFTAYSGLARSAGFSRADWQSQDPKATAYASQVAARLLPRMRAGIQLVRDLDPGRRPCWINEAVDSDALYVREYLDQIEITGCDYYPVRSSGVDLPGVGRAVDRWRAIGLDRPVWMVLQAFSWHAIRPDRTRRYPTFDESRFMAYDAIVHGARGVLYWGAATIDDPDFRASLLALTTELSALQPWWVGSPLAGTRVRLIDDVSDLPGGHVRALVRRRSDRQDYLLLLVNEDPHRHLAVEVQGLESLNGLLLNEVAGGREMRVSSGRLLCRLQPFEALTLTSGPRPEVPGSPARQYGEMVDH